jgi:hypothetical protein
MARSSAVALALTVVILSLYGRRPPKESPPLDLRAENVDLDATPE